MSIISKMLYNSLGYIPDDNSGDYFAVPKQVKIPIGTKLVAEKTSSNQGFEYCLCQVKEKEVIAKVRNASDGIWLFNDDEFYFTNLAKQYFHSNEPYYFVVIPNHTEIPFISPGNIDSIDSERPDIVNLTGSLLVLAKDCQAVSGG